MPEHASNGLNGLGQTIAGAALKVKENLGIGATPKVAQIQKEALRSNDNTRLTTSFGCPVSTVDNSVKAGERGPTVFDDFVFRDRMSHFDRERIPERVVHARGVAAHGYFEAYEDLSSITSAAPFQKKGKQTPVFLRFSTVQGSRGSADTVRDVRGFSVKFYTEDGNWDIVGNNIPVFFIQDAIKFPDLVHSLKPEPDTEIPQGGTAHDNFWDFVSLTPESTHMLFWIMSDRTIPRSLRMINGFGVHTFRLINKDGVARFVKFHWRPKVGVHSFVWDEALKTSGRDPDFHRRDLYGSIDDGQYPEWELGFQIIEEAEAEKLPFDILDATKLIPEEIVPIRYVGKMVLNRNVDEYFSETEQSAFHPGHLIPGIGASEDPLLQGRLFSYTDSQFYRIGTNYQELPINRPVCPVHNHQRDGAMRLAITKGKTNYHPNSLGGGCPAMNPHAYVHYPARVSGVKAAVRSPTFNDYYSQPKLFYNSMTPTEQAHIQDAFTFELSKVKSKEVQQRNVDNLNNVDNQLATAIAHRLGAQKPSPPATPPTTKFPFNEAKGLSILKSNDYDTIVGRMVGIFVQPGYDSSASEIISALKAAGAKPLIVSETPAPVPDASGTSTLTPDFTFFSTPATQYDAIFIPGGRKSVDAILSDAGALAQVAEAYKHLKTLGAVNEAVEIFKKIGLQVPTAGAPGQAVTEYGVTSAVGVGPHVNGGAGKALGAAIGAVGGASQKLTDVTAGAPDWIQGFFQSLAKHKAWEREPLAKKIVV